MSELLNWATAAGNAARLVSDTAQRSLHVLEAVESTVDQLVSNTTLAQVITADLKGLIDRVAKADHKVELDPDDRSCDTLRRVAATIATIYQQVLDMRAEAKANGMVRADDGLGEAFKAYIAALAEWHNTVEDLRSVIEAIDGRLSPVEGTFSNVDDLLASLSR